MHRRKIRPGISMIATVHWERRLFDSPIPLDTLAETVAAKHAALGRASR
jgi:hypothetical protein